MSNPIIVAYDGSEAGDRAVSLASAQSSASGAELIVAHVLDWSPYTFLTPEEIEERHKRRSEELARAERAVIAPVMAKLESQGVAAKSVIRYGHVAETLVDIAKAEGASQIFMGRQGHSSLASRLFGAVSGTLAQVSPVPVTIVP